MRIGHIADNRRVLIDIAIVESIVATFGQQRTFSRGEWKSQNKASTIAGHWKIARELEGQSLDSSPLGRKEKHEQMSH